MLERRVVGVDKPGLFSSHRYSVVQRFNVVPPDGERMIPVQKICHLVMVPLQIQTSFEKKNLIDR